MARRPKVVDDDMPEPRSRRRRRWKKRYSIPVALFAVLLVLVAAAPTVLTNRAVLVPLIDRYAGIAPLKIDFQAMSAGWFSPVSIAGLRLVDGQGTDVAQVGTIQTEKSLLSWILASQNLGTVRIKDVNVDVAVSHGNTSIEQALKPLMTGEPRPASSSKVSYTGAIELTDAQIALYDALQPEKWLVKVPSLKMQLPGPNQIVGPTQVSATIADSTGQASGTLAADVAESMAGEVRSFNVRAVVDHVPLGLWQVIGQRVPELPVDQLAGTLSARIAGSLVDQDRWSFNIENFSGDQVVVAAPSLVGDKPARLESIKFQGQAVLADGVLALQGTQLTTDVGGVSASGTLPWPVVMPTVTAPWLPGAQLNAEGSVDLARLVKVAETLVPMRDDTRLLSGSATFKLSQQTTASGAPSSTVDMHLGQLAAVAGGQQLKWDDALQLSLSAQPLANGAVSLSGTCDAEFCKITANGTSSDGAFTGQFDLDRLQQRLAQWIELPVSDMTGQAALKLRWSQAEPGVVAAEGQLETTPLVIAMSTGGQLKEPAWKGTFSASARLNGSQLTSLQRGRLELTAQSEKLKLDLLEPLQLSANNAAPAAFTLSAEGALDLWQKRAVMLKLLDPSTTISGNYSLGASGSLALSHLVLREANWKSQPFSVGSGGTTLTEPEMLGKFQGNVNTSDLSKLAIDTLVVQAHSFSLSAADQSLGSTDSGRAGTGAYIVDLGTLMRHIQRPAASGSNPKQLVLPPGVGTPAAAPESQLAFQGQVKGNLNWQVDTQSASLSMDAKSDQVDVLQQVAGGQPTRLWSEAQLVANLKAIYEIASGNLKVDSMQFQAPWMHYSGTAQVDNQGGVQTVRSTGQCLYDANLVATKLQPFLGNHVQMSGRKQVPVEVVLTSSPQNSGATMLSGLQAATRIGWEQARVVGIEVGTADVPVTVTNGHLATNAEIPVSGGKLRWDLQSDLTADQMVLIQKPMTVLENVAITPQMCQGWLKYVTPLLAEATSVDGRLSLTLNQARFNLANPADQTIDGQLVIHNAVVGPGPLSNQVIGLVQQINAIRKRELASTVGSQQVWMQLPQQAIAFRMENGRVMHRDLKFSVGDVTLASSGSVSIDGQMDLKTGMAIPDDWVDKSPLLAGLRGQALQLPIRGSLTAPQLDTQFLRDLGRQAATQAAEGLLQQQLSRGINKLFPGGVPNPGAPGTTAGSGNGGAPPAGGGFGLPQLGLPNLGLPQFGLPGQNPGQANGQNGAATGN